MKPSDFYNRPIIPVRCFIASFSELESLTNKVSLFLHKWHLARNTPNVERRRDTLSRF